VGYSQLVNGVDANLVGTQAAPLDPLLGVLGSYGGQTQTLPLLPGSAAIGASSRFSADQILYLGEASVTADQRGKSLPTSGEPDIGAFQDGGFTVSLPGGAADDETTAVNTAFAPPLQVWVFAVDGVDPVAGGVVSFAAPSSGASASLGTPLATINSSGIASTTATANSLTGFYQVTTASKGAAYTATFDLTNIAAALAGGTVSGAITGGAAGETIYLDANNNSTLDSGELSTTTTAGTGAYSFANVPAGAYVVRQVLPAGYTQTSPANGYGLHVTVTNGGNVTGQNFTDKPPVITPPPPTGGSVSGSVTAGAAGETIYLDANNNSILDTGELSTTTTAGTGAFSFTNVPAGAYVVRQVLPAGYTQTSPANGYGLHISVSNGGSITGQNFTDKPPVLTPPVSGGGVSGTVTNGAAGETIYLDANNNSTLDSGELSTTLTATGTYSFSGVLAGAYVIRQILPAGYTQTSPANGYGLHITVTSGGSVTGQNFADKAPVVTSNTASISGTLFSDANGDGKDDNGETGLSDWTLYIDPTNSGVYAAGDLTAITDSSGDYTFSGLAAGTYIVRVEPTTGYTQTTPSNNYGQHLTLTAGQNITSVLFGEKKIS
jgi:hypothetical protein